MYPCPSCVGVLPGMAARARGCPTVGALNPMSWLHCTAILYPTSVSEIMLFFVKSAPKVDRTEFKQNYPPPRLTTTTKKITPAFLWHQSSGPKLNDLWTAVFLCGIAPDFARERNA